MYSESFLPLSIMFISTVLSLYKTFDLKKNDIDFFRQTIDKYTYKKIIWYFSHFTFSNSIFLLTYYGFKLFDYNMNNLFISIAPISISVNLNYFLVLYPKKKY